MISNKKLLILLGMTLISTVLIFSLERIKQDNAYHLFADSRLITQIPNFFNVATNLPFVIIGILGIRVSLIVNNSESVKTSALPYLLFFVGVLLTGFGSAYYHLFPSNAGLLWDRLPLAALGIGLFCAVVSDCISLQIGLRLLLPLTALAIASVLYWYYSELKGRGDLRPYVLAQFLPILLLPLILWLYDGHKKGCAYVWGVLGAYVLAKVAESLDADIYRQFHIISGHSVKHLLAGFATYIVYAALKQRVKKSIR